MKMNKILVIALVVIVCVGISSFYLIHRSETGIGDKTLLIGTYSWNGFNYESTNGFTVVFTDRSIYTVSFEINSDDECNSETVILDGNDNGMSATEIRKLMHVLNDTIPNSTVYSEHGFIIHQSAKAEISTEDYNALTVLLEGSDFLSLNEAYSNESEPPGSQLIATDSGWSWITVNYNDQIKRVTCYGSCPESYQEIWEIVMALNDGADGRGG